MQGANAGGEARARFRGVDAGYALAPDSARLTREFSARADFEHKADALFAKRLERRGTSHDALLVEHEGHLRAVALARERR